MKTWGKNILGKGRASAKGHEAGVSKQFGAAGLGE